MDSSRQGLQAGTTWRPGWPYQKCQERQEDPRRVDFGGYGSLDEVSVNKDIMKVETQTFSFQGTLKLH